MYLLIALVLWILIILYWITKCKHEGMTDSLDTPSISVDVSKNLISVPNNIRGIQGDYLNLTGNYIGLNAHSEGDVRATNINFVDNIDNPTDKGFIKYEKDKLMVKGPGLDSAISLWGQVQVGSLLQADGDVDVKGKVQVGSLLQANGDVDVKGKVQVGSLLQANGDVEVKGATTHQKKVKIDAPEGTVGLSFGDTFGFGKETKKNGTSKNPEGVMFMGTNKVGGFDDVGLYTQVNKSIRFSEETDGANIVENKTREFLGLNNALEIHGSGPKKHIRLLDSVHTKDLSANTLSVNNLTVKGKAFTPFSIGNKVDLGKEAKIENTAKLKWTDDSTPLELIGAGTDRRIQLSNNVDVTGTLYQGAGQNRFEVPTITYSNYDKDSDKKGIYLNANRNTAAYFGDDGEIRLSNTGKWYSIGNAKTATNTANDALTKAADALTKATEAETSAKTATTTANAAASTASAAKEKAEAKASTQSVDSIKIGNWHIFEDSKGELRFSKSNNQKNNTISGTTKQDGISIKSDGDIWISKLGSLGWASEVIESDLTAAYRDALRGTTMTPHAEWGGDWKKHTDSSNTLKYVSNATYYWQVIRNGSNYKWMGNNRIT